MITCSVVQIQHMKQEIALWSQIDYLDLSYFLFHVHFLLMQPCAIKNGVGNLLIFELSQSNLGVFEMDRAYIIYHKF